MPGAPPEIPDTTPAGSTDTVNAAVAASVPGGTISGAKCLVMSMMARQGQYGMD